MALRSAPVTQAQFGMDRFKSSLALIVSVTKHLANQILTYLLVVVQDPVEGGVVRSHVSLGNITSL
jgi:acetyl-CoA carboxylase beta subunit